MENVKVHPQRIKTKSYHTIIIGSGIAGLYSALKLAEKGIKVAIITKSIMGESNSRYAQGGMSVVLPSNKIDSVELHVKDTLMAGAGLSDLDVANFISSNGSKVIDDLIESGVKFDAEKDKTLAMTLEGAHSVRRVLHAGGDATGKNIEQKLVQLVKESKNVDIFEQLQAVELLVDQSNKCYGAIFYNEAKGIHKAFQSIYTIIATGGVSQVYNNTTNPTITTGDGVAIAYRAGAILSDMEFIQFHPTALHTNTSPMFLISESVRGEGAKLRNINGGLFAHKYHSLADLAPRDIVTRSIFAEMKATNANYVYLDATIIPLETLNKRFPNIINVCKSFGIDISKEYIPVSPAAHYTMGGIKTDVIGKTSIKDLFAIGEAACSHFHGANRLASNSLLECVVQANELANYLSLKGNNLRISPLKYSLELREDLNLTIQDVNDNIKAKIHELINALKVNMWQNAGVIRNSFTLKKCYKNIMKIEKDYSSLNSSPSVSGYELRNLIIVSKLIIKSALLRKESRGAHYRDDYPLTSDIAVHSYMQVNEDNFLNDFSSKQSDIKSIYSICTS